MFFSEIATVDRCHSDHKASWELDRRCSNATPFVCQRIVTCRRLSTNSGLAFDDRFFTTTDRSDVHIHNILEHFLTTAFIGCCFAFFENVVVERF